MILPVLVAAALAGAPATEAASAPAATEAVGRDRLDVPVTLKLKDASVVDLLEKFADLLGVTPILDPGVGGRVSLELENVPVREAMEMVGRAAKIDVTVSARVLRARAKAEANASGSTTAPATTRTDPPPLGGALRFWLDGTGEPAVTVRVPDSVGRVELPGCAGPVTLGRLGVSGGTVGVALATADPSGGGVKGRILGESAGSGTKVLLAGCDGRLVVEVGDPLPGAAVTEPVRPSKGEPVVLRMRLLEVTEKSEESLSEPMVAFPSDSGFSVKSGFEAGPKDAFGQVAEIHGVPLDLRGDDDSLLVAVWAGVTRTPAGAAAPALVARRAETFRLRKGKPLLWTVDSSWDGGRAAIVLELTLERTGAAPR